MAKDEWKHQGRHPEVLVHFGPPNGDDVGGAPEPRDESQDPPDISIEEDEIAELGSRARIQTHTKCKEKLEEKERKVYEMWKDKSAKEIAGETGLSIHQVYRLYERASEKMSNCEEEARKDAYRKCKAGLKPEVRLVWELIRGVGMSVEGVAEAIGASIGKVDQLYNEAFDKIMICMSLKGF